MKDRLFTEAVKIKDGVFYNLPLHNERVRRTISHFFDNTPPFDISDITIPDEYRKGLVKCRIVYNKQIVSVGFTPYSFRKIEKLKIVMDNDIDYTYKWADRDNLDMLTALKEDCDDILIIKNGLVTDTSFANVVFENESELFTPDTYLLNGTKRQLLLQQGIIREKRVRWEDIGSYSYLHIINTMIDPEDNVCIPTSCIKK